MIFAFYLPCNSMWRTFNGCTNTVSFDFRVKWWLRIRASNDYKIKHLNDLLQHVRFHYTNISDWFIVKRSFRMYYVSVRIAKIDFASMKLASISVIFAMDLFVKDLSLPSKPIRKYDVPISSRCLLKNWTSAVDEVVMNRCLLRLCPAHIVLVFPDPVSVIIAYMKHLPWNVCASCLEIPVLKIGKHIANYLNPALMQTLSN